MEQGSGTVAGLMEKLLEFNLYAALLDMPRNERLGILNLSDEVYAILKNGAPCPPSLVRPELERRLNYALPLMRKLACNSPVVRLQANSAAA